MNTALRLTIKQWATEDRPTERLQRLGAESLTDAELLAILIGSGTQQYSAVDIGNQVLGKCRIKKFFYIIECHCNLKSIFFDLTKSQTKKNQLDLTLQTDIATSKKTFSTSQCRKLTRISLI